jgi:hypothetical protein
LQPVQRREPAGTNRKRGAGAVVWQAVPGGKLDDVELWREEAGGIGDSTHRRVVRRDENCPAFRGAREVCHDQRLRPARDRGEGQRRLGGKDAVEVGHFYWEAFSVEFRRSPVSA